ncbi:MAG: glycosyltransferase family 1 protein [Acidobacteriota bacterium]
MRSLRRLLSPLHPRRLHGRLMRIAVALGYNYVRLWVIGLHPRRIVATVRWCRAFRRTMRQRRAEPRLTVAVDVSALWEPLTGIGWYLYRLLEHLGERDDVRLRLYGPGFVDKRDVPPPVVELPGGPAIEEVRYVVPENLSFVFYYLAERLRRIQERLIAADGNRVLFAPNYFLPPWFDRCDGELVVMVHDLSFLEVPETLRESTRRDLETHVRSTSRQAARILTPSATVRDELIAAGLADAERVRAVPHGPGSISMAAPGAPPAGTPERYALHVGTLEPRKNVPMVLEAWRLLRERGVDPPPLVLCGRLGWKTEALEREIADATQQGWLVHHGYLSDEEVAALYRGALLVVLPSIYEGFGLPALEAMMAGAPLVCSDIPVLREVAGDGAAFVPPDRPEAWADQLARLLADRELRADLAQRGRERSEAFDWYRAAEQTVAVWKEAAGHR